MSPEHGAAPQLAQLRGPRNSDTAATNDHRQRSPRVWAVAYPPSGRRRHWLLLVRCCPHCGGTHAHRGDSGARRAGRGRTYYLRVRPALGVAA